MCFSLYHQQDSRSSANGHFPHIAFPDHRPKKREIDTFQTTTALLLLLLETLYASSALFGSVVFESHTQDDPTVVTPEHFFFFFFFRIIISVPAFGAKRTLYQKVSHLSDSYRAEAMSYW